VRSDPRNVPSESDPKADSAVGSNERTNERTNAADPNGQKSGAGSRRTGAYKDSTDGLVAIGDAAMSWLDEVEVTSTKKRWPVVRSGERDPIPSHIRAAVWYRDRGRCVECIPENPHSQVLHLDHIVPWSAGGADTTDNLRILCEYHNLERSNFVDFARPVRPATWWCSNCYVLDEHQWTHLGPYVTCPRHGNDPRLGNARCRVQRAYARVWRETGEAPTWHERPMLTSWGTVAYCAHCDAPALTGVVL
jgi:hypothetical protein